MKRAIAWALAATCAVVVACNREPGSTRRPTADPSQASVQARFPDLASLYGGEHGIYRSCGPNQGVCHNNAEYPDLSTLGSVTMIVGADCNRGREDPAERHDLCENRGDFLAFGGTTRIEIGAVVDDPAAPLGCDQAGTRQGRQMHRHRVLRDIQRLGDLAGGKAFGFVTHQKAEGVEARGLGKRAQRDDDRFVIHISTIADIWI